LFYRSRVQIGRLWGDHPSKGGEFFTRRSRNDSSPLEGQGWFKRVICHRSQYAVSKNAKKFKLLFRSFSGVRVEKKNENGLEN